MLLHQKSRHTSVPTSSVGAHVGNTRRRTVRGGGGRGITKGVGHHTQKGPPYEDEQAPLELGCLPQCGAWLSQSRSTHMLMLLAVMCT